MLNEYEPILVADAVKGKRKALKLLLDSYRPHLGEIVESELHSRDHAEMIIKSVNKRVKAEIVHLQNPADFSRMIEGFTRAECAKFARVIGQYSRSDHAGQNNEPAAAPQRRSEPQNDMSAAVPFQAVVRNHAPAAQPPRPAVSSDPSAAVPFRPVVLNHQPVDHAQRPAAPKDASLDNRPQRGAEYLPNRSANEPVVFRPLNMGDAPQPSPQKAVKYDRRAEGSNVMPIPRIQNADESQTELLNEESKTELLSEGRSVTFEGEPQTELLPQNRTEHETVTQGELLFKPDEKPQTSASIGAVPKVGLLVCVKGEDTGENFSLHAGVNRVGISEACDVSIKDPSLTENEYFEIVYDERRESFSLNPHHLLSRLFINDICADSPIFLGAHDTIRVGSTTLMLVSFQ